MGLSFLPPEKKFAFDLEREIVGHDAHIDAAKLEYPDDLMLQRFAANLMDDMHDPTNLDMRDELSGLPTDEADRIIQAKAFARVDAIRSLNHFIIGDVNDG